MKALWVLALCAITCGCSSNRVAKHDTVDDLKTELREATQSSENMSRSVAQWYTWQARATKLLEISTDKTLGGVGLSVLPREVLDRQLPVIEGLLKETAAKQDSEHRAGPVSQWYTQQASATMILANSGRKDLESVNLDVSPARVLQQQLPAIQGLLEEITALEQEIKKIREAIKTREREVRND